MAKNKAVNTEEVTPDGDRAINKFRVSDALIMIILALLCLTCVLPFIYLVREIHFQQQCGTGKTGISDTERYHI